MEARDLADLQALAAILSDSSLWTRGCYARTATGDSCDWNAPTATCWCLEGAWYLVTGVQHGDTTAELVEMRRLEKLLGAADVVDFNDRVEYEDVAGVIKAAIEQQIAPRIDF